MPTLPYTLYAHMQAMSFALSGMIKPPSRLIYETTVHATTIWLKVMFRFL